MSIFIENDLNEIRVPWSWLHKILSKIQKPVLPKHSTENVTISNKLKSNETKVRFVAIFDLFYTFRFNVTCKNRQIAFCGRVQEWAWSAEKYFELEKVENEMIRKLSQIWIKFRSMIRNLDYNNYFFSYNAWSEWT